MNQDANRGSATNPDSHTYSLWDDVLIPPSCPRPLNLRDYQWALLKLGHLKPSTLADMTPSEQSQAPNGRKPKPTPVPASSWDCQANQHVDRMDDQTDFRWDQELYNPDNLPEELYILDRPNYTFCARDLRDPGSMEFPIFGRVLRDIPCLPHHISSQVPGWLIEFWARIEPRLMMTDITDRMRPDLRPKAHNALAQRRMRFRQKCHLFTWNGLNHDADLARFHKNIRSHGLDPTKNSTRGLTPGLIDPIDPDSDHIQLKKPLSESTFEQRPNYTNGALVRTGIDHLWTPSLTHGPTHPRTPYYSPSVWAPPTHVIAPTTIATPIAAGAASMPSVAAPPLAPTATLGLLGPGQEDTPSMSDTDTVVHAPRATTFWDVTASMNVPPLFGIYHASLYDQEGTMNVAYGRGEETLNLHRHINSPAEAPVPYVDHMEQDTWSMGGYFDENLRAAMGDYKD